MKDVIFTGAKNSMNIAEVTLNFSNEDRKIDLAYDKIAISRRIYRSGENEYKINGKRVRLKDVRELFLDTGVGKEGYSIIGQGRIDEIILSTPKDRRAIFEEASGIAKHKYRRDEAEKKLDSVKDDLEIIEKELSYKEKDYDLYKNYKDAYLTHKDLTDQINQSSYFYFKNKSKDLLARKEKISIDINEYDEKLRSFESSLDEINKNLGPFRKDYENLKANLDQLRAEKTSYEKNIDKGQTSLDLAKQKLDYDNKESLRIREEIKRLDQNYQTLSKELNENQESVKNLVENLEKDNIDLQSIKDKSDACQKEIESLDGIIEKLSKEEESLKTSIIDYEVYEKSRAIIDQKREKDLAYNREKLEELENNLAKKIETRDELKEKYESLKESREKLSQELESFSIKIENLKNDLEKKQSQLNNLNLDIKTLLSDYRIEKDLINKNQGYFYSVQEFLNKAKSRGLDKYYLDTLANLISVRAGYEEIIDNLIGSGLQNIVTRTKDDTRGLINFVNKEKIGRITFLPMDSIKSFTKERPNQPEVIAMAYELVTCDESLNPIVGHFLGSTVVVENIDTAVALSKKIKGYRIISLNLDIINTWGSMVAGSDKGKKSNINLLNRKKRIKDLEVSINNLSKKKTDLENNIIIMASDLEKGSALYLEKKKSFDEDLLDINDLDQKLARISYEIDSLEEKKTELLNIGHDYDYGENKTDIKKIRSDHEEILSRLEDNKKDLDQKNIEFSQIKDELIRLNNQIEMSKRDRALFENTIAKLENSLFDIENNKKIQTKLLKQLETDNESSKTKNEKLESAIELYKKDLEKTGQKLIYLEEKLAAMEKSNAKLLSDKEKLDKDLNDTRLAKVKLDYKMDGIIEAYKNLEDEIAPFISMSIDDLEGLFGKESSVYIKKSDLIDLQKKINEVGFFTETALEDFDKIEKEVNFIRDQIRDLKNSKSDIEKMIQRLESEMKEEFSKNFEIINQNFSKIFKILFMGGQARLILDSDDFLTAGVEIEAKPPSKALKSISLLSGGEKALTAVALLFAIFEQNPAPFSILDEIDAALDESNIKRYIDYLKDLSDKTQFIMITHRQTTMQLAEKIHGVTIDDEGISKLYSIEFADD